LTINQRSLIHEAIITLKQTIPHLDISTPYEDNIAKQIAHTINDTIPQIYSWGLYEPIGRRWETQFNETSKIIAKHNTIPDCIQNDMIGWTGENEITKHTSCIIFRDKNNEHTIIQKRISLMKTIIETATQNIIEIPVMGKQDLSKIFYLILLGDLISYYQAILKGVDPLSNPIKESILEETY
jgi:glucose/mannose-6-phosphate isomerase